MHHANNFSFFSFPFVFRCLVLRYGIVIILRTPSKVDLLTKFNPCSLLKSLAATM